MALAGLDPTHTGVYDEKGAKAGGALRDYLFVAAIVEARTSFEQGEGHSQVRGQKHDVRGHEQEYDRWTAQAHASPPT